mgnify:CR=1 FL=1
MLFMETSLSKYKYLKLNQNSKRIKCIKNRVNPLLPNSILCRNIEWYYAEIFEKITWFWNVKDLTNTNSKEIKKR